MIYNYYSRVNNTYIPDELGKKLDFLTKNKTCCNLRVGPNRIKLFLLQKQKNPMGKLVRLPPAAFRFGNNRV